MVVAVNSGVMKDPGDGGLLGVLQYEMFESGKFCCRFLCLSHLRFLSTFRLISTFILHLMPKKLGGIFGLFLVGILIDIGGVYIRMPK